jgi:Flp pilus assembly pilin Flp
MFRMIAKLFQKEELGQDLAEYCLLTALLLLIGLGIFVHLAGGMQAIWGNANTALGSADTGVSQTSTGQPGQN